MAEPSLTPSVLQVREYLPGNDFKEVVEMLHKMYNFMKMTALGTISSSKGLKVGGQLGPRDLFESGLLLD